MRAELDLPESELLQLMMHRTEPLLMMIDSFVGNSLS